MNCSRSIVLIIVLLWGPIIGHAQPNEDPQERCRKQAEEQFQRITKPVQETDGYTLSFDFENHYSLRLNKCFYLLINDIKPPDPNFRSMFLHDFSQYYGEYVKHSGILLGCRVRGKECRSEQEWRELIKPFMED